MSDFEASMSLALQRLQIKQRGCLFHFIQAIIRMLRQDFKSLYRLELTGAGDDKRTSIAYRMFFADSIQAFDQAVSDIKDISKELHDEMVKRWVGPDHKIARKYSRAFMDVNEKNIEVTDSMHDSRTHVI